MTQADPSEPDPADTVRWIENVLASAQHERAAYRTLRRIEFPRATRLPRTPDGWIDATFAVTLDGHLAILRTREDVAARWKKHRADERRSRFRVHTDATLSLFDGTRERDTAAFTLAHAVPLLDRLADGSWLIVDRVAYRNEPNVSNIAPDGTVTPLMLGSDAEQLQADPDGGFWIGYGDRSIFGGAHGIEHGGVVRFDAAATPVWSMNDDDTPKPACVAWCDHSYALAISRLGRWAYTYTEFLLTRLDETGAWPRVVRPKGLTFADAIATDGNEVMLIGMGHVASERVGVDRIALLGPPSPGMPRRPTVRWIAAVHRAINPQERLWAARGDTLHCVRGRTWHRLSMREADAQVRSAPPAP